MNVPFPPGAPPSLPTQCRNILSSTNPQTRADLSTGLPPKSSAVMEPVREEEDAAKNIFLKRYSARPRYPAVKMASVLGVTGLLRHFRPMFHFML